MRKEVYEMLCEQLSKLYVTPDGAYGVVDDGAAVPDGWWRAVRHIDLWNHNVEFIEQEESWERPAVFVEFHPIEWRALVIGKEYRADARVSLHVVTDWQGSSASGSPFKDESLRVFDLLDAIHGVLSCQSGRTFCEFDLSGSSTNHNHEEIIENVETYRFVGVRSV